MTTGAGKQWSSKVYMTVMVVGVYGPILVLAYAHNLVAAAAWVCGMKFTQLLIGHR